VTSSRVELPYFGEQHLYRLSVALYDRDVTGLKVAPMTHMTVTKSRLVIPLKEAATVEPRGVWLRYSYGMDDHCVQRGVVRHVEDGFCTRFWRRAHWPWGAGTGAGSILCVAGGVAASPPTWIAGAVVGGISLISWCINAYRAQTNPIWVHQVTEENPAQIDLPAPLPSPALTTPSSSMISTPNLWSARAQPNQSPTPMVLATISPAGSGRSEQPIYHTPLPGEIPPISPV
jgi:hypothetical protein